MSRVCWPLALAFVLLSAPIPAGGTCPNSGLKLAIAGRTAPDGQVLSFLGEHFVEVAEDGDQVCTSCTSPWGLSRVLRDACRHHSTAPPPRLTLVVLLELTDTLVASVDSSRTSQLRFTARIAFFCGDIPSPEVIEFRVFRHAAGVEPVPCEPVDRSQIRQQAGMYDFTELSWSFAKPSADCQACGCVCRVLTGVGL